MIDAALLLKDLKPLLKSLTTDIRSRAETPALAEALKAEWQQARDAGRTAQAYTVWLDDDVTQAAVHWILACVFLRFVEDNGLVERPWLSGPGDRLDRARDRHESWFRENPHAEERDFLLACFDDAAQLPGMAALFDKKHNPLWHLQVSGDGAIALRQFWQRLDTETGLLRHDFHHPKRETRFLGDLYQYLSEDARKRYALLQTPEFVEEFILDRTLDPAVREFGFREVRVIDPTCGSGHFLLGAFRRMFDLWMTNEPGRNPRDAAQQALKRICGVDLNPFAIAIARFRLLVAALGACGNNELTRAPDFKFSLAVGDSLLHGKRFMSTAGWQLSLDPEDGLEHVAHAENREMLDVILGQQYHAVIGNPPYITVKDRALNGACRQRYPSTCHGKYSLGVPFTERFFDLAIDGSLGGFVGLITANSFMKREFGSKLIENFFRHVDLTHVIDTSGAYIPGHGTPTVILLGRNRKPVGDTVRAAMGVKGEPSTPVDPARGLVWLAILAQLDQTGSDSAFISVVDLPRSILTRHPWSIGGGGKNELQETINLSSQHKLGNIASSIGVMAVPGEEEVFIRPSKLDLHRVAPAVEFRHLVEGEAIRDWSLNEKPVIVFPYNDEFQPKCCEYVDKLFWPHRVPLAAYIYFGKTRSQRGMLASEYGILVQRNSNHNPSIAFAFVSTHNHFILEHGNKIFKQSAPMIKLSQQSTEEDHYRLLELLNSSTACFWMKQVLHNKGSTVDERGARQRTNPFEDFFEFTPTGLQDFPIPVDASKNFAQEIDLLSRKVAERFRLGHPVPTRAGLDAAQVDVFSFRRRMIALQEELDWRCYSLYGLTETNLTSDLECSDLDALPEISLGERAFEIVLARKMDGGELETTWFDRHRSKPIIQLPAHWPQAYRKIVERRIDLIESDRWINLIERPEYKRRWQWQPWKEQEQAALKCWLLDRLEDPPYWSGEPQFRTIATLTDLVRRDGDFMHMAELYTGRADFQILPLLTDLIAPESVPYLPALRYSTDGLRKRQAWEETWDKQRDEDTIDARTSLPATDPRHLTTQKAKDLKDEQIGPIPVPPKYKRPDFLANDFWRLRGGLDVPKERFISYPGASPASDGTLLVAWAGYDHLQQARALAVHYLSMKDNEGWSKDRLVPLLAGLAELIPWLRQWHAAPDPDYDNTSPAEFYANFLANEARAQGETIDSLRAWAPPAKAKSSRTRRTSRSEAAE